MPIRYLTLLLSLLAAAPAQAGTVWHCSNPDLEIGCGDGRCQATPAGEFTPMDVDFSDDGSVSACAYSGCWDGAGEVQGDARYLTIIARDLAFSTAPDRVDARADVVLVLDREDDVAVLKMAGYAQPLVCEVAAVP